MFQVFTAFFCQLIFVFLKAFQQRNVAFDNYKWVFPTSLAMAAAEYAVVALIVQAGYSIGVVLGAGTGAGLGCLGAMLVHKKYVKKEKEEQIPAITKRA